MSLNNAKILKRNCMSTKFRNILALLMIFVSTAIFAQVQVSGVVKDDVGEPLAGVMVENANGITAETNEAGQYTIEANEGEQLKFSSIGFDDKSVVVTDSTLDVQLSLPEEQIQVAKGNEVVVTAMGVKREKKALGYSAQEVKGDILSSSGQLNAVNSLSGNVAGVQVSAPSNMGGSTRIVLRGPGSVTGENRPLIVIDGVPLDNSNYNSDDANRGAGGRDYGDASFDINPNDIESVTVLKGGPAAALYGSRGGNGVIVYTTKSAKKGKSSIVVNSGISFESVYKMPKLQNQYGGGASDTFKTVTIDGKQYNIADYATDESWGPKYDSNLMYLPWYAFDPEFADDYLKEVAWVAPKNDVKDFYNTGISYSNSISLTKSYENLNLMFSLGNVSQEGILPNSKLDKTNFTVNFNTKLSERFSADGGLNYVYTKAKNRPEVGYGDNSVMQKFFQWGQRQLDMETLKDYMLSDGTQRAWNRSSWNNATPKYSDNPYWVVNKNISHDTRSRVFGNVGFNYKINDYLTASTKAYYDTYSLNIDERVAIGSQAQSSYTVIKRNYQELNTEGKLTYVDTYWDDNLSLTAFAGVNQRNNNFSRLTGTTNGGLVIADFYNLSNSAESPSSTNYESESRVNSVFGMASLGYKDTFFIEASARQDWFSTVNDPAFYPSVSGSFVFSKVLNQDWLNFGKIRGGWAKVSSGGEPYQLDTYTEARVSFNGVPRYSLPDKANNPNLKPEFKKTIEVGLEARMFKNRVGFDVTLYKTNTTDLITPLEVDPGVGYPQVMINAGEMENKGIEILVNVTPIKTDNFSWDVTWNFSKNENKLLSLYGDSKSLLLARAPFRASVYATVGESYGQIYGTDYVYDENGNKVIGSNGLYKASAIKPLGSVLPDYNTGIRNTFRYKNLSLTALVDIQKGGKYFSTSHMWGMYSGMLEATAANGIRENGIVLDGVLADGTVNTQNVGAQTWAEAYYNTVDAQNVFDAGFVKLREVNLSYSIPKSVLGNTLESVQISAFARNLFTWGLDWDIDPEQASNGSGNVQGIEGGSMPSTRTYGFNVQFKF